MRPMYILAAILVLACATGTPATGAFGSLVPTGQGRETLLRQALELEQQGHHRDALQLYREASLLDMEDEAPRLGMARVYLAMDRLAAAEQTLAPLISGGGSRAEVHVLMGEIYYKSERLAEAVSAWERALSEREDSGLRAKLEKARREMKWTSGYQEALSSMFIVRYKGNASSDQEGALLRLLEGQYDEMRRIFGGAPRTSLVVVLYPESDFQEATLAPERAVGLYDGKIRVPSQGIDLQDVQFQRTLRHELTHAFVHALGGDKVPRWLHEGLAERMEGTQLGERERLLARLYREERGGDWGRLFSYPLSLSFVNHLIDRAGLTTIGRLLNRLQRTGDMDAALLQMYGRTYDELAREWGEALLEKYP